YLVIAGPGMVVMVADNDAGGITTYAATGAKYGYHLIWFLLLLIPVAYYVQEMTVRLGAVTKRGHAEAIFDGFGAFWGWFSVRDVLHQGLIPNFAGGFNGQLFFFLMANIGTTIAPWMLFFQQSAVVDKGMLEKDIPWGRFDTLLGSIVTVVVAVFIIIVTGTVLPGIDIDSAAQAAQVLMKTDRYVGTFLAIGLFDAGLLGAICISLA